MSDFSSVIAGVAGGAFFLIASWFVSNWINWKVNNRVYLELVEIHKVLVEMKQKRN